MEQMVSLVLMVRMVSQVQKVGNLPTKVPKSHTQPEHYILSVLSHTGDRGRTGTPGKGEVHNYSQSSTLNIFQ